MLPCCSNRDLVLTAVMAVITFGAAACAGPKVVDDPVRMQAIREAIAKFEPRVIDLLGTQLGRDYEIHILAEEGRAPAATRYPRRDLYFSPRAFEAAMFERLVAHELVHVHALGVWDALPEVIEQGLAEYISFLVQAEGNHRTGYYDGSAPDLAQLVAALRLSDIEYMLQPPDPVVTNAALWLVCSLGIDGTLELAQILAERGEEHAHVLTAAAALEARSP